MTTREKAHRLLDELPESEVGPVLDFIVSRQGQDEELGTLVDEEVDEILAGLDAREGEAATEA